MLDFVLNFLFPPICGICGNLDKNWLCFNCRNRLKRYEKFKLIKGYEEINKLFNFFLDENFCGNLEKNEEQINNFMQVNSNKINNYNIYFEEFLYCFEYRNLIRNLLLKYKFAECSYLGNMFGNVILNNKKINEIFQNYDIIIPVPMDKIKKKKRGYNQTELIMNYVCKNIDSKKEYDLKKINVSEKALYKNIIIDNNVLIKNKLTKTQSTLKANERRKNVKEAFVVNNLDKIKDKNIILFDDIATTGSTVNEISKILKFAGARKILVLVVAKD